MTGEHATVSRVGEAGRLVTLLRAEDGTVTIEATTHGVASRPHLVELTADEFRWLVIMAGPTVLTNLQ